MSSSSLQLKLRFGLVSLAVLVLDQWTKHLIETRVADRQPLTVVPGFIDFIHVENTGIAFGLLPAGSNPLGVLALILVGFTGLAALLFYFWLTPEANRSVLFSLALILGGAVGNVVDRVMSGAVTDFIDVYVGTHHWYTFNVADSALTVGIAMLLIDALWMQRPAEGAEAANPSEP